MRVMKTRTVLRLAALAVLSASLLQNDARGGSLHRTEAFARHWFEGRAELVRFELEQARYGESRRGDAVLIFVTEDFLPVKQVKADSTNRAQTGAIPVMKLNFTRKFITGIYPYSMMTSVFTPIDVESRQRSLKTSTTVQEWCGHTYLQLNLRDGRYLVESRSYFESEADRDYDLPQAWLEDEIWTRIRLDPESLPVGSLRIIPGAQQSRLRHRALQAERATARLEEEGEERIYTIEYTSMARRLAIRFSGAFPHEILGWEETHGRDTPATTTRATRTHTLKIDYWNKNRNVDASLRRELGLD